MTIMRYTDKHGHECKIFVRPQTLSEVEQNYHPCNCSCQLCNAERDVEEIQLQPGDVVEFGLLQIPATQADLAKSAAGAQLTKFAKDHMTRRGGTFEEAMRVAYRLNPEWQRAYLPLVEEKEETPATTYSQATSGRTPAQEIAHRMGIVKREHPRMTATELRDNVLKQDPALKAAYSGHVVVQEYYENDD